MCAATPNRPTPMSHAQLAVCDAVQAGADPLQPRAALRRQPLDDVQLRPEAADVVLRPLLLIFDVFKPVELREGGGLHLGDLLDCVQQGEQLTDAVSSPKLGSGGVQSAGRWSKLA